MIKVNGDNNITNIEVNNTSINKVLVNNILVWEKIDVAISIDTYSESEVSFHFTNNGTQSVDVIVRDNVIQDVNLNIILWTNEDFTISPGEIKYYKATPNKSSEYYFDKYFYLTNKTTWVSENIYESVDDDETT